MTAILKTLNLKVCSAKTMGIIRRFAGVKKFLELIPAAQAEGARLGRGEARMLTAAVMHFGRKYNQRILVAQEIKRVASRAGYNTVRREKRAMEKQERAPTHPVAPHSYTIKTLPEIADDPRIATLDPLTPFTLTMTSAVVEGVKRSFQFSTPLEG